MIVLIDSYSEVNRNSFIALESEEYLSTGQSFTCADTIELDSCKFYLKKYGLPTGNAVARLYAHSGTYGTSSVPTGSALATSDIFNVATLTTNFQLITFNFSGSERINLNASTYYVIAIEYTGGDSDNYIFVGIDTASNHSGNFSFTADLSSWTPNGGLGVCFYVYGEIKNSPFPMFLKE